ncbi:MAG: hypothetical protein LAO77_15840 [Acidobacteriia bacterium]|nr:hypothetical protein [Terriglobia bacterium]
MVDAAGGALTIPVTAQTGCTWTAQSNASFLSIATVSGSGSGLITVTAPANADGGVRTGTITIAGQTVTIAQPTTASCPTSLSPSTVTVIGDWESVVTVAVTAAPSCVWAAKSNASFIVAPGGSSTGSGSVNVTVAANPGSARTGTVTVGNQTLTVNQQRTCGYSLSATTLNAAAGGGDASVAVSTLSGCAWSAVSNSSFIALTSASANTGSGAAIFSVAANAGATRDGTLTLAGHTVSIIQAGSSAISACVTTFCVLGSRGCGLPPPSLSGAGGSVSAGVFAPSTCSWFVTTDPWLTADPPSGSGNATIQLRGDPNPSSASRTGNVAAGGATLTVGQAACVVTLSPSSIGSFGVETTSFNVAAEGATISFSVITMCASWNITGTDPGFLTVLSGATGSGNGTVTIAVAPNAGGPRSASFAIGNATVTINQEGQ